MSEETESEVGELAGELRESIHEYHNIYNTLHVFFTLYTYIIIYIKYTLF
jgi:hypothetical protein